MNANLPMILPVILAGGAGTRLWPVSREAMPKHLANIMGGESLLQQTVRRVMAKAPVGRLITVAAKHQDLLIQRQLQAIDPALADHRLLEPLGRNTAAAIALAALYAKKTFGGDAVLWVCPSDHLIENETALGEAVDHALPAAADGDLLTFGIQPTRPETGYGYIAAAPKAGGGMAVLEVERFVEKPDLAAAKAMIEEGTYLWNSGMFLFRADRIIEELGTHEPSIIDATEAAFVQSVAGDDGSLCPPQALYEKIPSMPIDKAVMERTSRIAVVPCNPDWTDLGSWQAIWERSAKDADGNACRGDVLLDGAEDCLVHASSRLVACAAVRDLAIIESGDAVLVVDRERSEPVKALVAALNDAGRSETRQHQAVDHAWGQATLLDEADDTDVQKLEVLPGKAVSDVEGAGGNLHWVVMSGGGEVEHNGERRRMAAGDSVDLKAGAAFRLSNDGEAPLRILQVSRPR